MSFSLERTFLISTKSFAHFLFVVSPPEDNYKEDKFDFTGFLNGGAERYNTEVRKENLLRQLGELLGEEALHHTSYFDKLWTDEYLLHGNPIIEHPYQNKGILY
jgi:hypothetical protein